MSGLRGYDFERFFDGDYDYTVCTSRRLLWLRRRLLPFTLRYEARHEPPHPHGLIVTDFPLLKRIGQTPAPGTVREWKVQTGDEHST